MRILILLIFVFFVKANPSKFLFFPKQCLHLGVLTYSLSLVLAQPLVPKQRPQTVTSLPPSCRRAAVVAFVLVLYWMISYNLLLLLFSCIGRFRACPRSSCSHHPVFKLLSLALSYFLLGSAGSGQLPAGIPAKTVAIFAGPAGPGRAGPEVWGSFGEVFRKRFRAASGAPRRRPGRGKNHAKKR